MTENLDFAQESFLDIAVNYWWKMVKLFSLLQIPATDQNAVQQSRMQAKTTEAKQELAAYMRTLPPTTAGVKSPHHHR